MAAREITVLLKQENKQEVVCCVVVVMQFFPPELSISQEIGLSIFLHQHFIHGQTIQFIHENT
jgi:hypothetical protein